MWEVSQSVVAQSTSAIIWELWEDVEHWNRWDAGVRWSRIDGPFTLGTRGRLKPTNGPTAAFTITRAEAGHGFDDTTALPFCRLEFSHDMVPVMDGVRITHTIRMSGPLTWMFSRLLGRQFADDLRLAVAKLAQLAEQRYAELIDSNVALAECAP